MGTDLAPIGQDSAPTSSLGYIGIEKLDELRTLNRARVETITKIGLSIAQNGFRIIEEDEVREIKREKNNSYRKVRALESWRRIRRVTKLLLTLNILGGFIMSALTLWLYITRGVYTSVVPLLLIYFVLFVWGAWKFTGDKLIWHKVPIAEYLPPLISPQQHESLNQVNTDLVSIGVTPAFFVNHGSANYKSSITKAATGLTAQGKQLSEWKQEIGLIALDVTFPDGDVNSLVIGRTISFF